MDRKIILLAIISCINANHLNTNLLPPDLPPANVANIFHESGITFVSPSSHLEISSSVLAPPLPVTHAFGFVSHSPNGPQELVRTHSSQLVAHGLHSSVSALSSPNGIHSNVKGQITSHRYEVHSPQISHDEHINEQSLPADVVQARFVENDHHAIHEINSRTQHFEYKVPFTRTVPQQGHNFDNHERNFDHHEHNFDHHEHRSEQFNTRNTVVKHSTYGVPNSPSQTPSFIPSHISSPSQIPSQIPSETPTFTPSHVSSSAPSQSPSHLPSKTPTFIPANAPSHLPSQDEINEPTFIPSQDEIDALPVFQNDKFLSPFARHTKTPITHSNIKPSAQTIENIFDTSFRSNSPRARTRVNTFHPSTHSTNTPTTSTRENIIGGNNQYSNRFSLPDGTKVSEQGKLISPQKGWENVIAKTGEYEYVSPEGIPVKVKWIADHQGFRVLN